MIVAKYKFNPNTYADLLPVFNNGYTSYTKSDTTNSDGTITRTIESSTLPTSMRFGETSKVSDRSNSLLEVLDMNTSNLTSMYCMFNFCTNLTSVSCTWNTSQVIDTAAMFMNCSSLTTLDVSKWNTSKVTNMATLFHGCKALTSLDISNWKTSQVTTMFSMFTNCSSLTSLDVSKWDVSQVTVMSNIFHTCSSLTSLDLSNWNTSKVTSMMGIFQNCSSLTSLDVSNWDTSKVTDMSNMFNGCISLTSLNISNLNTSKVTNMASLFLGCKALTSLNLSNWDVSQVTVMRNIFHTCSSLTSLDLSNWNTSKVTNMMGIFQNCSSLTSLDITNLNTSKVTNMSNMFGRCSSLTQLDVSNLDTSKVTNMANMFNNCTSLTSLDISNWNTSRVTSMQEMFKGCSKLTSLDLNSWDTSKVTNINAMFSNCSSLTSLDLSNWDASGTTNMNVITYACDSLHKINLKYADEYTVSKIHENLNDRTKLSKGYILSSADFTSNKNWQIIKSSHNNFYLPQPLRKIGDLKDRLYWDENKGHYCIEQMICRINISDYDWWELESSADGYDTFKLGEFNKNTIYFPTVWGGRIIVSDDSIITLDVIHLRMKYPSSRFNGDVEKFKEYCLSNGIYALLQRYGTDKAITIDLPYLNQKLTFDSYNPSTTIDIPNRPLKASKTYLDAPIARYRYTGLQPNTQYNVQCDCKGDSGIKVNLGGTEVTFTPTSDWTRKNLTITTPSELVNDKLSISNVGIISNNKVDNVMLFSEVIAQEPDYIDGIQNIGELQEDGTYKIDILSNDGNKIFDADTWVNSTLDGTMSNSGFYKVLGSNMIEIIANDTRTPDRVNQIQLKPNTKYSILCNDASLIIYIFFKLQETGQISGRSKIDFTTDETGRIGFKIPDGVGKIVKIDIVDEKGFNYSAWSTQSILLPQPLNKIGELKDRFYWDDDKGHYCIEQNVSDNLEVLISPNIIDLTEMNKKITFDTYLPNTYVDVTNLPLEPYSLQLEDDTVRYKSTIEPSTLYTIQFNCIAKLTTRLTLDLGGSRVTVDPIIGVNHVQITTPSELTSDRLFLIGTGIVIKEVIVNKGTMNQYPKYFDGEQSVGELQDDGSYKITLETYSQTNNIFNPNQNYVDGKFINDNGEEQVNTEYGYALDFIESAPNTRYVGINTSSIYCYDANKQFISRIPFWGNGTIVSSATPSNCYYVRFQLEWSKLPNKDLRFHKVAIGNSVTDIQDWNSYIITIHTDSPLTKLDKIYWNDIDKRYEIDRNGVIEVPTVEGDIINLPRLYQKVDTTISISTDNIEPSKIAIEYNDINNN